MLLWLRRFIRRTTRPIREDTASRWSKRLSILYIVTAWNAGGLVLYMCLTGRADWAKYYGLKKENSTPYSQQWAEVLNIPKAHVIQMKGFSKVGEYDIDLEKDSSPVIEGNTDDNLQLSQ